MSPRVIAGRFGSRRITAPPGDGTRPTSERVREALFSILGALDGERVLDLFAGTGALGIEALSRGAGTAEFVESDRRVASVLQANLDALGVTTPEARVHVRDAVAFLGGAPARGDAYDLVFLDPPYRDAASLGPVLQLAAALAPNARVVCESARRTPLELDLPLLDERRYGSTLIRIHSAPDP